MTYQPNDRPAKGLQSLHRPSMGPICDVCGIARTKGNHHACSKARQAAGFRIIDGVKK